ncbi:MAG: DUF5611 family protein [Methanocellales archaeon]
MQQYKFKRGYSSDRGRILAVLRECFPVDIEEREGRFMLSYGALHQMQVWVAENKLCVETKSNLNADSAAILDTNKRFRVFLEKATGYTAKQRVELAKREVIGD